MPDVALPLHEVGDRVVVDHPRYPGVWVVTKINPTTYQLDAEDGSGRKLRAHKEFVQAAPTGAVVEDNGRSHLPAQHVGALVRYVGHSARIGPGQLMVVIDDKWDMVRVARLGGDEGRYWRVPPRHLEAVPFESIAPYLPHREQVA